MCKSVLLPSTHLLVCKVSVGQGCEDLKLAQRAALARLRALHRARVPRHESVQVGSADGPPAHRHALVQRPDVRAGQQT